MNANTFGRWIVAALILISARAGAAPGDPGINCGNFSVSGGTSHTCAVVAGNGSTVPDDLIECWGNNTFGQSTPPTGTFKQVSAGAIFTCGLRAIPGKIECWGYNGQNQVSNAPTATDFIQVDSGFGHACGLHQNHTVTCWGDNTYGESTPPGDQFVQIGAGSVLTCGLRSDGRIICWGLIADTPTLSDFVQVVAGGEHACGRRSNGRAECWGADYSGETADKVGPFVNITAGDEHNCALSASGLATCWGDNTSGQSAPPADAFLDINAGSYHTCALLGDGTTLCFGDNSENESIPPARSLQCPICGNAVLEGRETCEAPFATCCSPVTCTPYRISESHTCRNATGACDGVEICDGLNLACPAPGPLLASGTVCRGAIGSCDPEEKCTGSSDQCPPSLPMLASTTLCRAVAGSCDISENCNGTSGVCPTDAFVSSTTTCRPSTGVCDLAEKCTGSAAACPADSFRPAATQCRPATDICDAAENCSGSTSGCPTDAVLNGATICRPAAGVCDLLESCDSTNKACPPDTLQPNIVTCRIKATGCDAPESCTGTSVLCPADGIAGAGTTCRAAVSACDVVETCTGGSNQCPADLFGPSSIVCRAAADACDVAERCTGSAGTCPANAFAGSGTSCNDGLFCNGADTCNGSGSCAVHVGIPCPGPDGDANCAETCNEASDNCTTNDPNGSACSDGNPCTNGDTCSAGTCTPGTSTACDDGDICTFDTCDATDGCVHLPGVLDTGCLQAAKGQLYIKTGEFPFDAVFKWKWVQGEQFAPSKLGTPNTDTDYALCIFDNDGGEARLAASYDIPAALPGWSTHSSRVTFSDKDNPSEGISKLIAKAGSEDGKSVAGIKGAGSLLNLPNAVSSDLFFFGDPSVIVQLRNSKGACWSSTFVRRDSGSDFKLNDPRGVKAGYQH